MDVKTVVTIVAAIFGCTGFWTGLFSFIMSKREKKDAKTKMILGLGHERLREKCEEHLSKGYISADDYEDLDKYLYQPYKAMGGNGTVEKLMNDVRKLPLRPPEIPAA